MKKNHKYYMVLVAFGNPDYNQNPESVIAPIEECRCNTLAECRKHLCNWIDKNGIGSGNYPNTGVWDTETKKCIGKFSYNGRLWDHKQKEIVID